MADSLGRAVLTLATNNAPLNAGLDVARRDIDKFGSVVTTRLAQLGASVAGGAFLRSSFQAASNLETISRKLTNTLGENGTAGALSFIRETAGRTGLSFTNLADGFSRFTAAASAAGVPLKEQERLFAAVAKAGQAYGLSNDEVAGSLLALQQIAAKGVVQSEELRGQLGERLPVALSATAKGLGLTVQELQKLVESGKLTSQQFFPAFTAGLEQLTASAGASQTAAQALTQLNDAWTQLQVVAGNSFLPAAVGAIRDLTGFAEGLAVALSNSTETGRATQELRDVQKLIGIIKGDIEARKELKIDTSAAVSQLEELERRATLLQQQLDKAGRVEQIKKEAVELKQLELSYQRQGLAVDAVVEKQKALARELFTLTGSTAPVKAGQIFNGLLTDVVTITPTATANLKSMREEVSRLETDLSRLRGQESAGIAKGVNVTGITEQRAKVEQELIRLNRELRIEAGDTGAILEKQRESREKQSALEQQIRAQQAQQAEELKKSVPLQQARNLAAIQSATSQGRIRDAQVLLVTESAITRETLARIQSVRQAVSDATAREAEIGVRIDSARLLGQELEAGDLVRQQQAASEQTRLQLIEGAQALRDAANELAERGSDLRKSLEDGTRSFAQLRASPDGLNQFLSPQDQERRNQQSLALLRPQFADAAAQFRALTGAQAPNFQGSTGDVVRQVSDFIAKVNAETDAGRDLATIQRDLADTTKAASLTQQELIATIAQLAAKDWTVQVGVSADGSAQVFGDAVNAAL